MQPIGAVNKQALGRDRMLVKRPGWNLAAGDNSELLVGLVTPWCLYEKVGLWGPRGA